jgi:hypothetical protein
MTEGSASPCYSDVLRSVAKPSALLRDLFPAGKLDKGVQLSKSLICSDCKQISLASTSSCISLASTQHFAGINFKLATGFDQLSGGGAGGARGTSAGRQQEAVFDQWSGGCAREAQAQPTSMDPIRTDRGSSLPQVFIPHSPQLMA